MANLYRIARRLALIALVAGGSPTAQAQPDDADLVRPVGEETSQLLLAADRPFLLPIIERELGQLRYVIAGTPVFGEIVNANRLLLDVSGRQSFRRLLDALDTRPGDERSFSESPRDLELRDELAQLLLAADDYLRVNTQEIAGAVELQMVLYRDLPDTVPGALPTLTDIAPSASISVIIDPRATDYEARVRAAVRRLIPTTNRAPIIDLRQRGGETVGPKFVRLVAGDTLRLDASGTFDPDGDRDRLRMAWRQGTGYDVHACLSFDGGWVGGTARAGRQLDPSGSPRIRRRLFLNSELAEENGARVISARAVLRLDPGAERQAIAFEEPGLYQIVVSASDGTATATESLCVYVSEPPLATLRLASRRKRVYRRATLFNLNPVGRLRSAIYSISPDVAAGQRLTYTYNATAVPPPSRANRSIRDEADVLAAELGTPALADRMLRLLLEQDGLSVDSTELGRVVADAESGIEVERPGPRAVRLAIGNPGLINGARFYVTSDMPRPGRYALDIGSSDGLNRSRPQRIQIDYRVRPAAIVHLETSIQARGAASSPFTENPFGSSGTVSKVRARTSLFLHENIYLALGGPALVFPFEDGIGLNDPGPESLSEAFLLGEMYLGPGFSIPNRNRTAPIGMQIEASVVGHVVRGKRTDAVTGTGPVPADLYDTLFALGGRFSLGVDYGSILAGVDFEFSELYGGASVRLGVPLVSERLTSDHDLTGVLVGGVFFGAMGLLMFDGWFL